MTESDELTSTGLLSAFSKLCAEDSEFCRSVSAVLSACVLVCELSAAASVLSPVTISVTISIAEVSFAFAELLDSELESLVLPHDAKESEAKRMIERIVFLFIIIDVPFIYIYTYIVSLKEIRVNKYRQVVINM